MEIEFIEEKENKLFNRKEIKFYVDYDGEATPKILDIKSKLVALLNTKKELLVVDNLAHKLALEFPRIDESQMTRLQNEVSVLVDNVRTPRSVERNLLRKNYWDSYGRMSQSQLLSGEWI